MYRTRASFTHTALLSQVRSNFTQATKGIGKGKNISTTDCLMSGLAIFSLKYKSLLKFEEDKASENFLRHNLKSLYGISKAPCDTYLRERLDYEGNLSQIRPAFYGLFSKLQRNKSLDNWKFMEGKFLISLDGTGFFSSNKIHCEHCCEKVINRVKANESKSYYHQMLVGSIVSPNMKQVLPICFEPISRIDGSKKNDCERNCGKRWLEIFRQYHPQLPAIIVGDGLYSNAPFIDCVKEKRCSFIFVAKEADHKYLYDYFWAGSGEDICEFERLDGDKKQKYRIMKNVPLNESREDIRVNVLHFQEYNLKTKQTKTWLWVTDIEITRENAKFIMMGGRSRWKIENETFNTLKNQGYNFEHNFGHGYKELSNVFAGLMLLAFCIDQILEACNLDLRAVFKKYGSRSNVFEKIRGKVFEFMIVSFERLYEAMLDPPKERWL